MSLGLRARLVTNSIILVLGLVIITRGVLAASPLAVVLGVLFLALGAYRLHQYWHPRRSRNAP